MLRNLVAALALSALVAPAFAADVRAPSNASGGSGMGGSLKLPEMDSGGDPGMRTTMQEKRKSRAKAVPKSKVMELRRLAIEEFGQASSKSAAGEGAAAKEAPGVDKSREAYFQRMRDRGVRIP